MSLLLALAAVAALPPPAPLGILPRQQLAAGSCAAFLWQVADAPPLLAMIKTVPTGGLRIVIDGREVELARAEVQPSAAVRGLSPAARYAGDGISVTTALTVEERANLANGALIPSGSLTIERTSGDAVVVPVSGMLACR